MLYMREIAVLAALALVAFVPVSLATSAPTSAPTYNAETVWDQTIWDKKRHRSAGLCENHCSGHGTCELNNNCKCFQGLDGEDEWTGPDCSQRTCPRDFAWVGEVVNANDVHPWTECPAVHAPSLSVALPAYYLHKVSAPHPLPPRSPRAAYRVLASCHDSADPDLPRGRRMSHR